MVEAIIADRDATHRRLGYLEVNNERRPGKHHMPRPIDAG